MIRVHGLCKLYDDFPAVQGLDLDVGDGEIMGIIGHNGAGKTTTIKMLLGLLEPSSGTIEIMDRPMPRDSLYVKRHVGYLPEESALYENLTVREYLLFFGELYGVSRREAGQRTDSILESLRLPYQDRLTGQLSKGMRRKVAIARALLHDPKLLILDEPNSGLDPLTSFFIINYLRELRDAGKTILLSAHNLFHVEYICDRVAILKDGRLVICDTMQAIRQSLGKREYEIVFKGPAGLEFELDEGNYVVRTEDIADVASVLRQVSAHDWELVNLGAKESALEEIYVNLMSA